MSSATRADYPYWAGGRGCTMLPLHYGIDWKRWSNRSPNETSDPQVERQGDGGRRSDAVGAAAVMD